MTNLRQLLFSDNSQEAESSSATATKPTKNPELAETSSYSLSPMSTTVRKNDASPRDIYHQLKASIHRRLLNSLELSSLVAVRDEQALSSLIEQTVQVLLAEEKLPLNASQKQTLTRDVLNETLGLGPLEPLLADPGINDILVNGYDKVWIDRNGKLELTEIQFKDDDHLLHVINRVVARIGRRVDESSPIVDARLPDGSRVNAIIPPLALDGPILSIRRFPPTPFKMESLLASGTLSPKMAEFLKRSVQARLNIMVSGGTSAGKTTILNVLSASISDEERIITIEDTAELRLQQRHVLRLESRPSNMEGSGAVGQRELVKNALRMRPDRILVGEVRGPEALDMLQAMNTGHEGSLTTIHANTPRDALSRLETLVLLSGVELNQRSIREQIASAFDLIIQVKRLWDGSRKIVSITEVTGVQEGVVSMQELYTYKLETNAETGAMTGDHFGCDLRPYIVQKFNDAGIELSASLFTNEEQEE